MADKESKARVWNLDTYLYVISLIKKGNNLTQVADRLNIRKQSLTPHSNLLKTLGILKKIGLVWEINEKNLEKLSQFQPVKRVRKVVLPTKDILKFKPNTIRGHAFQFTIRIPKIHNWEKREEYLNKKNIKTTSYKPHKRVSFTFNNHKIRLYPESITIWFPIGMSYFSKDNALAVFERAKYDCFTLIKRLENLLGRTSFTINGNYWIKPSMAHYSLIKNSLAKKLYTENRELRVRNHEGKEWLIVDNSFQFYELEVQGKGIKTVTSAQNMHDNMNYLDANPTLFRDYELKIEKLRKELLIEKKETLKSQLETQKILETLDRNMQYVTKILSNKS